MKAFTTLCLSLFLSLGAWSIGPAANAQLTDQTSFIDPDSLSRMIKRLCGKWEHAYLAADIFVEEGLCTDRDQARTASLRYAFRPDGTFSKGLHCAELGVDLITEGRWSIAPDGNSIILERFDEETPYQEILYVHHLDADEMIIQQALSFHKRPQMSNQLSELYFNKL